MYHLHRKGHARAPEGCLAAFYGHKIVGDLHDQLLATAILTDLRTI